MVSTFSCSDAWTSLASIPGISAFTTTASLVSETSTFGTQSPRAGRSSHRVSKKRSNTRSISCFNPVIPPHGTKLRIAALLWLERCGLQLLGRRRLHRRCHRRCRALLAEGRQRRTWVGRVCPNHHEMTGTRSPHLPVKAPSHRRSEEHTSEL